MKRVIQKWAFGTAIGLASLISTSLVKAENHALIMWIGEYADPSQNLPGIDVDAANARKIAKHMGVSPQNISEYANSQLTLEGMQGAIRQLARKIKDGDKVLIYYSGHGGQVSDPGTSSSCIEGMAAYDGRLYFDKALRADLDELARKASQVVMLNDSCFSGGALSKGETPDLRSLAKPKFYASKSSSGSALSGPACGQAINAQKLARNLQSVARERGTQMLYVAASADNELSFANSNGSVGTSAWEACLAPGSGADADRNGFVDGRELQNCAQQIVNRSRPRQTVTLLGNTDLLVSFAAPADANIFASTQRPTPPRPPAANRPNNVPPGDNQTSPLLVSQQVNPVAALQTIRASSDPSYSIQLALSKDTLKIRQDFLDFNITTNRGGYLYLLHVGSDGQTFDILFPNKIDTNNFINSGTHRFPRPDWAIQAFGPSGTGYLMAYISDSPKDLTKGMQPNGVFSSAPAEQRSTRNLGVVMTGAEPGASGRFGASQVIPVREFN